VWGGGGGGGWWEENPFVEVTVKSKEENSTFVPIPSRIRHLDNVVKPFAEHCIMYTSCTEPSLIPGSRQKLRITQQHQNYKYSV
jgi:hypothetical protein